MPPVSVPAPGRYTLYPRLSQGKLRPCATPAETLPVQSLWYNPWPLDLSTRESSLAPEGLLGGGIYPLDFPTELRKIALSLKPTSVGRIRRQRRRRRVDMASADNEWKVLVDIVYC